MFEFVRKHTKWLMAIILLLTAVAFMAPQGYTTLVADGAAKEVASVDGQKITEREWDAAVRQTADRIRQQQPDVDPKLLDSPETKQQVLEQLIEQRVLSSAARNQHLEVSNERLKARFERDPQVEGARTPTGAVNKAVLAAQGMTEEVFVARYREDLRSRQVLAPVQQAETMPQGVSAVVASTLAFDALLQRRAVRVQRFDPLTYMPQVQISDEELAAHYAKPETQKQWLRPESAEVEYLVLDVPSLKAGVTVQESELKSFYEQNAARFNQAEERRARHILLKVEANAPEAEQQAVKAKAEALLAQVRKAPEKFAEIAKQNSQDEGSAANGGDLDFFSRGAMVKPFEDATYALKVGEISPLVRSEFGWHIIQLEATRGGASRPFEQVRAEIEEEQRTQLARQRYLELAETFSTMVFEQPDSLLPAAEKLGLSVQRGTMPRQPQPGQTGPLASPKLAEAVFAADALRNKRNTDAVETGPSQLVSARVVQHQPAAAPPLDQVKDKVRMQLQVQRAAEQAKKAGTERLAKGLTDGDEGLSPQQWVSRAKTGGLPQPVIEAVLRAPADKLPGLIGLEQGQSGYWLVKLEQVGDREPDLIPADIAARQYAQAWAAAENRAYLAALKRSQKAKQTAPRPAAPASAP